MRFQSRLISHDREKWMRSHATLAEKRLWTALRTLSFKFRRQHRIKNFIVDFYCPEVRLVIEVDGSAHSGEAAMERDFERDARLCALGMRIIHLRNEEVLGNLGEVIRRIEEICLFL